MPISQIPEIKPFQASLLVLKQIPSIDELSLTSNCFPPGHILCKSFRRQHFTVLRKSRYVGAIVHVFSETSDRASECDKSEQILF